LARAQAFRRACAVTPLSGASQGLRSGCRSLVTTLPGLRPGAIDCTGRVRVRRNRRSSPHFAPHAPALRSKSAHGSAVSFMQRVERRASPLFDRDTPVRVAKMTAPRIRRKLRALLEHSPFLAHGYSQLRSNWILRTSHAIQTPFGFTLAGHAAMARGDFERNETAFLEAQFPFADVFVDVGANVGLFSCLAARRGKRVVAIEPLRENQDYLYRNILENDLEEIEVFTMGVSRTHGILTLHGARTGASLIRGWAAAPETRRATIALTTLDTLLGSRFAGERLLIKIDVEGAEMDVLQGAQETLRRIPRPVWLVEVCLTEHHPDGMNPHFAQVFDIFLQAGYQAYTVGTDRRQVTAADVARWVATRRRDFGSYSYEFSALDTAPTSSS
jgi:FkbM family methyltransferase